MKIATWNVNSIKARLGAVTGWLRAEMPDVLAMQEIKTTSETFPREAFEDLGYNCTVHGQKTYNGVAILSKRPPEDVVFGLADDAQARYLEARIPGAHGMLRLAAIYAPNGNPVDSEKYPYKIEWMQKLQARARDMLRDEEPTILAGDFNIIPTAIDCYDPAAWQKDALFLPQSRAALNRLLHLGFTDAFRTRFPQSRQYTFWDYQGGAWDKDHGLRIDFQLLSPQAQDRLTSVRIDKSVRGGEKPSDHVPVICEIDI